MRRSVVQSGHPLALLLVVALLVSTLGVTYLLAKGRFSFIDAIFFVAGPWALLAAALRPDWLVLGIVALPASVTALVPPTRVILLLTIALVVMLLTRASFSLAFGTGITALVVLIVAASSYHADVGQAALETNDYFTLLLTYYALLALLAYNLTRSGELDPQRFAAAFVVGVFSTLILGLAGFPSAWFPSGWAIVSRTYLGYLAAGGFSAALAWRLTRQAPHPVLINAATFGTLFLAALSLGRAVWISAAVTFTILAWRSGRRAWIVVAALVVGSALLLPGAQQEIASSKTGDILEAFRTGEISTGRWDLWVALWERGAAALPLGNGFGYTWSLTAEELLGVQGVFTVGESTLVPPHNDFLFLFVEFGFIGVLLLAWFWGSVIRAYLRATMRQDWRSRLDGNVLLGILITGFVMSLVDNLFSILPFAERFFPAAGIMWGLAHLERSRRIQPAAIAAQSTPVWLPNEFANGDAEYGIVRDT